MPACISMLLLLLQTPKSNSFSSDAFICLVFIQTSRNNTTMLTLTKIYITHFRTHQKSFALELVMMVLVCVVLLW